jgi:hypothetical protein
VGKKIVISESQYNRVFLNEQNVDKKVKPNAIDIQKYLIKNGYLPPYRLVKNKKYRNDDGNFRDLSAEAFAKYYYGGFSDIKTIGGLYDKLKSDGYDLGGKTGKIFGVKMANVLSKIINDNITDKDVFSKIGDFLQQKINSGVEWLEQKRLDIGDTYLKKHIKTKSDGQQFRNWVYQNNDRLKKVNNLFKKLGYSEKFSKVGPIDNKYFMSAWYLLYNEYLKNSGLFPEYDNYFYIPEDGYDWKIEKDINSVEDENGDYVQVESEYWYPEPTSKNKYGDRSGWNTSQWVNSYSDAMGKKLNLFSMVNKVNKSFKSAPEKAGYKKMYWVTTSTGSVYIKPLSLYDYEMMNKKSGKSEYDLLNDPMDQQMMMAGFVDSPYPLIKHDYNLNADEDTNVPVFWSYVPNAVFEQTLRYDEEIAKIENRRNEESKKEYEREKIKNSVYSDMNTLPNPEFLSDSMYLPFNSINGWGTEKYSPKNSINLNNYINNYNKCLTHWKNVRGTFKWVGSKVVNMNDKFIDTYKFKDIYDTNKDIYNFGTFETFLKNHPTDIFNPSDIIKLIGEIYEKIYIYDPNTIMSRIWTLKKLEELGCVSNVNLSNNYTESDLRNVLISLNKFRSKDIFRNHENVEGCPKDALNIIKQHYKNNESDSEKNLNGLLQLLEFVDQWNKRFLSQKKEYYKESCGQWINSGGSTQYTRFLTSFQGPNNFIGQTWGSFCQSGGGGNWLYYPPSGDKYGNKDYLIGCGCVNMKHKNKKGLQKHPETFFMLGPFFGGDTHLGTTSAEEGIMNTVVVDVRPFSIKAKEWADNCKTDWHCWVDIASIALALVGCFYTGVAGCLISGGRLAIAADTISGLGYVYEGVTDPDNPNNQGWKLNAAFSFLPIIFKGAGKSYKFLKGIGNSGDLQTFSKIIKSAEIKYGSSVWKGMSEAEKSKAVAEAFQESFKDLSVSQINKMQKMYTETLYLLKNADYQKLVSALDDVPYSKVGEIEQLMKLASKDSKVSNNVLKLINEGKTFNDIIKIYNISPIINLSKGAIKDFLFQSTLFALIQFYPEPTAKIILGGIQSFEDATGVPLKKWLGVSTDVNPKDSMSMTIQKGMGYFENWSTVYTEISNYLKNRISPLLLKYDIDISRGYVENFIINGVDSLFGEPLNNYKARLELLVKNTEEKEEEGLSFEEIKGFLQEMYNSEIDYLENYTKEDNLIKQIKKESEDNPPNEDTQQWIDDNNINMDLFDLN